MEEQVLGVSSACFLEWPSGVLVPLGAGVVQRCTSQHPSLQSGTSEAPAQSALDTQPLGPEYGCPILALSRPHACSQLGRLREGLVREPPRH